MCPKFPANIAEKFTLTSVLQVLTLFVLVLLAKKHIGLLNRVPIIKKKKLSISPTQLTQHIFLV